MKNRLLTIAFLLVSTVPAWAEPPAEAEPPAAPEVIHLFNGKDLSNFYSFLKEEGLDRDPRGVFTVQDGLLRVSGEQWGSLMSREEFENFHLIVEYRWGEKTFEPRTDCARDSGVWVHCVGKEGVCGGAWMLGVEVNIIEGGTGDLLILGDGTENFLLTVPAAGNVYDPQGEPRAIGQGRIDWWGRDPEWKDEKNFRGPRDLERPIGQWNRIETIAVGRTVTVIVNGVLANQAVDVQPRNGKVQVQSEGAEIFFRRIDLIPLAERDGPAERK